MTEFTHLDKDSKPNMVDIGAKKDSKRRAIAQSIIQLDEVIVNAFETGQINEKKGSVFHTATLAGIMGVKQTSNLIPLCHPLAISNVDVNIRFDDHKNIIIDCSVDTTGKTGVEMEALAGATIAALTIYDMCKAMSQNIIIKSTRLIHKSGGKTDFTLS